MKVVFSTDCRLALVNPLLLGRSSNVAAWSTCVERAQAGDLEGARAVWLAFQLFDGARDQLRSRPPQ